MNLLAKLHQQFVFSRRVEVLSDWLCQLLPRNASVLDVGCGSGTIARSVSSRRADLQVQGIDVLVREQTDFPISHFDGSCIPFADNSFDVTLFVDVLHHTDDPMILLREASRVSRGQIFIKDHSADGPVDQLTLRFMDWVGNRHHGVSLPYNYWGPRQWREARQSLGLQETKHVEKLGIYGFPATLIFDRHLHFISIWQSQQS